MNLQVGNLYKLSYDLFCEEELGSNMNSFFIKRDSIVLVLSKEIKFIKSDEYDDKKKKLICKIQLLYNKNKCACLIHPSMVYFYFKNL